MNNTSLNLKRVLEFFNISNASLAKAINIDASLVSRWITGKRQLNFTSDILSKLAEYLLDKIIRANKADWIIEQLERDGLKFDYNISENLLNGLKIWLSGDGDKFGNTLVLLPADKSAKPDIKKNQIQTGYVEIAIFFEKMLDSLPDGFKIDVHLSSEDIAFLLHESISRMLHDFMIKKNGQIRFLVSMSSGTMAMSRLLCRYAQAMIEGLLNVAVVHGMTQAIANQATFIFGSELVFIVSETPKNAAPPVGAPIHEESFIKESKKSFEHAYNYSQPLLTRFDDNLTRNVIEIMYFEFATPGNLDIMKDNLNPVYLSDEAYLQFINTFGYTEDQLKWRIDEFYRFKKGIHENLESGTVYREIISLARIKQVIKDGFCKMPALYFFGTGIANLDAKGCLSVLEGYIKYLNKYPSFHLVILDEISELNENNCWHIKQNIHWMLNGWNKDEHIILYTNQLMLTHEFQTLYDDIWNKAHYSEGRRKQTIKILQESIAEMKSKTYEKNNLKSRENKSVK
ncbi:MAG: helix-turn-helix domain-containing protein [Oscillospiraceae bacterium]|nr:helix-turn-helix domain-containing protein [Oscillospiraceae bacterium]